MWTDHFWGLAFATGAGTGAAGGCTASATATATATGTCTKASGVHWARLQAEPMVVRLEMDEAEIVEDVDLGLDLGLSALVPSGSRALAVSRGTILTSPSRFDFHMDSSAPLCKGSLYPSSAKMSHMVA